MPLPLSITPDRPFYTSDNNFAPLPHWKQPEIFNRSHLNELPPLELLGEIAASLLPTTQTTITTEPIKTTTFFTETPIQLTLNKNDTTTDQKATRIVNLSKSSQKTTKAPVEQIDVNEMLESDNLPIPASFVDQTIQTTIIEPSTVFSIETNTTNAESEDVAEILEPDPTSTNDKPKIRVSKEGNQIKLEWDAPEKTICDNYLVNTTLIGLGKSFSTASGDPRSYIKFYNNEQINVSSQNTFTGFCVLQITINCMSEGTISTLWLAEKFLDLNSKSFAIILQ